MVLSLTSLYSKCTTYKKQVLTRVGGREGGGGGAVNILYITVYADVPMECINRSRFLTIIYYIGG